MAISEEDAAGNLSYPVVLRTAAKHGKRHGAHSAHGKSGDAHSNDDGEDSAAGGGGEPGRSLSAQLVARVTSLPVPIDIALIVLVATLFARRRRLGTLKPSWPRILTATMARAAWTSHPDRRPCSRPISEPVQPIARRPRRTFGGMSVC